MFQDDQIFSVFMFAVSAYLFICGGTTCAISKRAAAKFAAGRLPALRRCRQNTAYGGRLPQLGCWLSTYGLNILWG